MLRPCVIALALTFVGALPANAQDPTTPPSMAGHVITKKQLAECKKKARDQKLTYFKRQKFVRACVNR